jgi:hypothetical protein
MLAMHSFTRNSQYPLPSYQPWQRHKDDRRTFTGFLEDAERRRHQKMLEDH